MADMRDCGKCAGTGWWQYDHNHQMPCPDCCLHDQGVWWLTDAYQPWQHAGEWNRWCCTAGCGTTWAGVDDYRREHRAKKKIRETLDNGLHPA